SDAAATTAAPPDAPRASPVVAPPPPPRADPVQRAARVARRNARRFGAVLDYYSGVERTERYLGAGLLVGSAAVYALGGGMILLNPVLSGNVLSTAIGVSLLITAPISLAVGLVSLAIPGTYERFDAEYRRDLASTRSPG